MRITSLLLVSAVALLPASGFALGFRLVDHDAYATARGGAFAATADRPSAIYYNPAGIGMLEGQRFQLGAYGVEIRTEGELDSGKTVKNKHEIQAVPQLFYSGKLADSPFTLGFGVYSPFGLGTKYPEDSPIRDLSINASIKYVTFNPVLAWKISNTLSVAAGPTINVAQADLKRGIQNIGSSFEFEGEGVGYGFNAGILWQPHPMHSFGLTYRSATTIDFSGHSKVDLSDQDNSLIKAGNLQISAANQAIQQVRQLVGPFGKAAVNATLTSLGLPLEELTPIQTSFPEEDASAKIHFPQSMVAGYSFRPTSDWNLEFNLEWTDWDSLNTVTLHQQKSQNVAIPFDYEASFLYEFGVSRSFKNGCALSAGYIYSENSVPNETFSPAVPDANRHIFSAGVGFHGERVTCDVAYQFAYSPSRNIDNGTAANGDWQTSIHGVSLTVGYRF